MANYTELLYKKLLGSADAYQNMNVSFINEKSSRPFVFNDSIYAQKVPSSIPNDFNKKTITLYGIIDSLSNYKITLTNEPNSVICGKIYVSDSFPYIQKISNLILSPVVKGSSYCFTSFPSTVTNYLSNMIPFNYGTNIPPVNYSVNLTCTNTGNFFNPLYDPKWFVDPDAGYLYFPNADYDHNKYGNPVISFYRYNGTIGITTNLGNFAGYTGQGANALAIGNFAGAYGQGTGSIAIGNLAGPTGMSANSIVLNASGTALYGTGPTGGFYVAPVGSYSGSTGPFTLLAYGADKQIVGITGDALTALGIVGSVAGGVGGGVGGGANYNIGNDVILSGSSSAVPTPQRPNNDDGGFYVSPVLGYTGSSSTTFNVLGYGSNDKEVITLPITLDTKDVLMPMAINNNLQLPTLVPGNLTYINNSGLLTSTDVTVAQLANMSGVNPTNSIAIGNGAGQINQATNSIAIGNGAGAGQTNQATNSIAIGNGAGADVSGFSDGTYTKWLKPSVVANNNITGIAMSANGYTRLYALNFIPKQWSDSVTIYKENDILYNSNQYNYYYVKIDGAISLAPSGTSDTVSYSYINLYSANLNLSNSQYVSHLNTIYKISVTGITLGPTLPTVTYDSEYYPSISNSYYTSNDVILEFIGDTNSARRPRPTVTASPRTGATNSNGYITINYAGTNYNGILWSENMYIPSPSEVKFILKGSFSDTIKPVQLVFNLYTYTIIKNSYTLNNPPSLQNWPTGVSFTSSGYLPTTTNPNIYKSVDSGSTFVSIPTSVFPSKTQYNYVVSGDGKCIIVFAGGLINFYFSRDAGKTIASTQSFTKAPLAFAISNTGDYIMLVSTGGIYITNSTSPTFHIQLISPNPSISTASCAMSSDGQYMMAIANSTTLYVSSNYGKTFTAVTPPMPNLSLIAISGTGSYQLVSTTKTLYVSTNTGGTFASKLSDHSITIISSIAVSRTGQYMIACCSSASVKGYVYYSIHFGDNWQIMPVLVPDFFNSCAISADGTLFTVSTPSNVYTLNNNLIGNTVAIGNGAGQTNQAGNSVAIGNGAGQTNQPANTIAINASGTALNPSMSNGCYIAPIADVSNSTSTVFNLLGYGSDNQVVKSNVFINSTGNSIINNYSPTKEDIGYFLKAGNASFYIGDDYSSLPTGSVTTYGRYFGTGGNIYQDFSGSFIWRRVTNVPNALGTSVSCMTLNNNGDLRIDGKFGIGTNDILFPLHVVSSVIQGGTTGSYYFNYGQASIAYNTTWMPVTYDQYESGRSAGGIYSIGSIITYGSIVATATKSTSDFRIKKNIQTRTGLLNTIDKLRIVSYDHIDPTKGAVSAGIIAQEVASIDPASVMSHSEVLPNIFTLATHTQLENGMIHIVVEYTQSVDITEGATVRLIIQKTDSTTETSYDNTLVNLTPNSFDIKAWDRYESSDKIFVYGTKVQNFLTVDKGQLSMIALGGVKELYQHVKVLQSPNITIGNRTDPTVGNFKITYDADKSTLVMGSSINGFVNKQFLIHQSAPANSFSITADGTVYNNGTLVSSDRRIKTDIESISDEECLTKINRLNVVKYNYTNPSLNGANKVIGFIAQEVREAIPEAVDITTKNIYWSNALSFTVGQSNTTVESTYTSLSDKDGKTYTITNGVVYDASNTAVFYFRENILISVYSTPTRNDDGKMFSGSKTYDLSKDDTYVLHTHSLYKQTDVMISIATVDVSVGNIVGFVYNDKKYEGVVMTVDPSTGEGSTMKVVTPDIFVNGTLQTYEKVIQDFHMLSKEKIFALTVGAIQDLTTANTALKSQVGSLQSQVGSLQSQLSTLMNWAKGQGFTDSSA